LPGKDELAPHEKIALLLPYNGDLSKKSCTEEAQSPIFKKNLIKPLVGLIWNFYTGSYWSLATTSKILV